MTLKLSKRGKYVFLGLVHGIPKCGKYEETYIMIALFNIIYKFELFILWEPI